VEKVNIASNPVSVHVKALPVNNVPSGYDGAVGKFRIRARLDKEKISLNDVASLSVSVSGSGNFGVINAPVVRWPSSFEIYDPSVREDYFRTMAPMQGSKTFQFRFMPRQTGEFLVPPVIISYFDPQLKKYQTVLSDSMRIAVLPASGQAANDSRLAITNATKPSVGWNIDRNWIIGSAIVILGLLAFALYRQIGRRRNTVARDESAVSVGAQLVATGPAQTVHSFSMDPLIEARLMMAQQNCKGFYAELRNSLWKYVDDRFPHRDPILDHQSALRALKDSGLDELVIEQYQLLVQHCELALYTPDNKFNDMQSAFDLAEDFLAHVDARFRNSEFPA